MLVSAVLGGCHDPVAPAPRGDELWFARQAGYAKSQPAVTANMVIVGTGDGFVQGRSRTTGTVQWQTAVGSAPRGANIVVRGGMAIVAMTTQTLGIDAATGTLRWTYEAPWDTVDGGLKQPGNVVGITVDADETTAYVPAWGGTIAALNLQTGAAKWTWSPPSTSTHRHGAEGVVVAGNTVYATVWHFLNVSGTSAEGWVVALDRTTGAEQWRTVLPAPGQGVTISGRPAVASGRVFVQMMTGDLFRLDAATGAVTWHVAPEEATDGSVTASVLTAPVVVGDLVVSESGIGVLRAHRVTDGASVWRVPYGGQLKSAIVAGSQLVYGVDGDNLHVFDTAGKSLGTLKQPEGNDNGLFPAAPLVTDGSVYLVVNGGFWAFKEAKP